MSNYYSGKNILRRPFPYSYFNVTLVLIVINVIVYLFQMIPRTAGFVNFHFTLIPQLVLERGFFWQVFTYMFLHGSTTHILFNMFVLFMFGTQVESRMGSYEFLLYYLLTGLGTGLAMLLLGIPVVGASGALFALTLAFATYFPDATILLFFVIPLRAPMAVLVIIVLSIVFQLTGAFGNIAHLGHLAGLLFGFLYFIVRLDINPIQVFRGRYR